MLVSTLLVQSDIPNGIGPRGGSTRGAAADHLVHRHRTGDRGVERLDRPELGDGRAQVAALGGPGAGCRSPPPSTSATGVGISTSKRLGASAWSQGQAPVAGRGQFVPGSARTLTTRHTAMSLTAPAGRLFNRRGHAGGAALGHDDRCEPGCGGGTDQGAEVLRIVHLVDHQNRPTGRHRLRRRRIIKRRY